jgi:Ca2+-binding EF-hand superfamily protein
MNKELQRIFEDFDVNGDGILSHEELIMGYEKMLGCSKRAAY